MPKPKAPSKASIKRAADRAEGKETAPEYDPLNPTELEELEGEIIPVRRSRAGRPPAYKPEYARIAKSMLKKDALISELAEAFGVTNKTIYQWRHDHPEFCEAFSEMGPAYDARIERTFAERALGYTYDAVKVFQFQGQPVIVPYREHVPPDINALKHWMNARMPEKWRVKEELEVSTDAEAFMKIWSAMGGKKNKPEK